MVIKMNRILQMDVLLPRNSQHGLMTFSPPFLERYCYTCSLTSSFAWLHLSLRAQSSSSSSSASALSFLPGTHNNFFRCSPSEPVMEKDPKKDTKDQLKEGYAKSSCNYDPSNRAFDEILPHILNIYGSRATGRDFEIYAPDATFEDPLMRAEGVKQIKSAFYSLAKVFSESRIVEYSVKENVISPGMKEILMDNKQYYKFLRKDINMTSLIKLHIKDGKIVRHEDWWDKKPLRNRETVQLPLLGRIIETARRGSMLATHALMGFGKDPTQ